MKYVLNVPYGEKDQAKVFGAKFNQAEKRWYYEGDELPQGLNRWFSGPNDQGNPVPTANVAQANNTTAVFNNDPFSAYKTVSEVNSLIRNNFRSIESFRVIQVKGEITNYTSSSSGHYYFSLKDENALLPCIMWQITAETKLHFPFENGKQVAITGKFDFHEKSGKSSLNVTDIAEIGEGASALALQQLKARLEAEGLFNPQYKKPIPKFPQKVGIVTSKDGQARKDIEKIAKKRNPYVQLLLYSVNVQGENAVRTIIEGIEALDRLGLDTIIVGRGGGSNEDLSAYNNEAMARTVFNAHTPIISAVGHEGNWSLIDLVSDKRAATPSEAAEEAIPDIMSTVKQVETLQKSITDNMRNNLQRRIDGLKTQKAKLEGQNPEKMLKNRQEKLKALTDGLEQRISLIFRNKKSRCDVLIAQLHGLSPTAKLVKGFGYITVDSKPVVSVNKVNIGDTLKVQIHDGYILSCITDTMKGDSINE